MLSTCAATRTRTTHRCGAHSNPLDSASAARSRWPTARSALPTTGSKSHHATAPHGRNTQSKADTSHTFACNSPKTRIDDTSKPHDFNVSVSNSEMLSWELHATFAVLHPLSSITPDQWALHPIRTGVMPTDRVHGLIGDKLRRGYTSGATQPPPTGPTLRTISLTHGHSLDPHRGIACTRPQ